MVSLLPPRIVSELDLERHGASVRRVDVRGGRAAGVELEDGTVLPSRRVISGVHPVTTYRDLVGFKHLPDEVVRDIKRFRTRSGSVKLNLALSELPARRRGTPPGPSRCTGD
ncbi:MAG: hypothetical protein ACR2FU_14345 [Streptosporangiaceae bacterium]